MAKYLIKMKNNHVGEWLCNNEEDLSLIQIKDFYPGTTAYCISNQKKYILDEDKTWKEYIINNKPSIKDNRKPVFVTIKFFGGKYNEGIAGLTVYDDDEDSLDRSREYVEPILQLSSDNEYLRKETSFLYEFTGWLNLDPEKASSFRFIGKNFNNNCLLSWTDKDWNEHLLEPEVDYDGYWNYCTIVIPNSLFFNEDFKEMDIAVGSPDFPDEGEPV